MGGPRPDYLLPAERVFGASDTAGLCSERPLVFDWALRTDEPWREDAATPYIEPGASQRRSRF